MQRSFDLYLKDILDAIECIREFVQGLDFETFKKDRKTVDAVVRNLEIVGEAVAQLQIGIKEKYPEVSWQEVKNFRNVIIHKYFEVDKEMVWDIIEEKLNPLHEQIAKILAKEKEKT